ncbi:mandelate racemase/muconate lactonizing enzyme/methylaspartate ammonia-lyase [Kipferlia bialata]|uniref:Mandelate racemase/muconate lactonizing enzyme/methylaspartate ammonia-lyase n=1 Tax=Kipferlia bialata TaxID=797122 RepID=A0A9K3CWE2_9EUKA|nr:mandelate racemase/muconate lactonizing enzyme/methylaspartate ammonia-lyase [Kipferlia bialata]|eukprot:g5997.t1
MSDSAVTQFSTTITSFGAPVEVTCSLHEYRLALRIPFETAHSRSTFRTNALTTLTLTSDGVSVTGYGEAGLPPLRPGVYNATFDTVTQFTEAVQNKLIPTPETEAEAEAEGETEGEDDMAPMTEVYDPFAPYGDAIAKPFFPVQDSPTDNLSKLLALSEVFKAIDAALSSPAPCSAKAAPAGAACWEMAALDVWGRLTKTPLHHLTPSTEEREQSLRSYYTVGVGSPDETKVALDFGLSKTSAIKLKVGSDASQTASAVEALAARGLKHVAIDANCSHTPESASLLLDQCQAASLDLTILEQPFPVEVEDGDIESWSAFKDAAKERGVVTLSDESFHGRDPVANCQSASKVASAVNIKLEKVGGVRQGLLAAQTAKQAGLDVWAGIMVVSTLGVNASVVILKAATLGGDLDGALLVTPDSDKFSGGWQWGSEAGLGAGCGSVLLSEEAGLGVTKK